MAIPSTSKTSYTLRRSVTNVEDGRYARCPRTQEEYAFVGKTASYTYDPAGLALFRYPARRSTRVLPFHAHDAVKRVCSVQRLPAMWQIGEARSVLRFAAFEGSAHLFVHQRVNA